MRDESGEVPVVVTGASGFIGRAVVDELATRGVPVIAIARRTVSARPGVTAVRVGNYRTLTVPRGSTVVHLASEARVAVANRNGAAHIAAETALADAVCRSDAKRIVYASSAQVYGDIGAHLHCPGEIPIGTTPYADAKISAEKIIGESGGVVARLSNVYGLGMSSTLIADVLAQIPGTGPLRLMDADSRRDFLWLGDAARGLVDMALGEASGIYNLASGKTWSAAEVARLALRLSGEYERQLEVMRKNSGASVIALDINRTIEAFGWRPEVALEDGVRLLLEEAEKVKTGRDT